jgi:hypothetical protein
MKSLKKLGATGICGISQDSINGLDLVKLYAGFNPKITDVSHMKSLNVLNASGNCGINQNGVYKLGSAVMLITK